MTGSRITPTLALRCLPGRFPEWRDQFAEADPDLRVVPLRPKAWPRKADFVAGLALPAGFRPASCGAKAVFSLGAGVDMLIAGIGDDPTPIVRLRHPDIARRMTEFVVMTVLAMHRRLPDYFAQRRRRQWRALPQPDAASRRVAILGFGELGRAAAAALSGLGFPVAGWRRSDGSAALRGVVASADVLVVMLPHTGETEGLIDRALLRALPPGAAVVSCGRGPTVDDRAIVEMVREGRLSGAALDVLGEEPPPRDHPGWRCERILLTPHVASVLPAPQAAQAIVGEIARWKAGLPFANVISRDQGY